MYDTCTVGTGNETGLSQMLIDHEALCSEKKERILSTVRQYENSAVWIMFPCLEW